MRAGDKGVERGPTTAAWNWQCRKRAGKRARYSPESLVDAVNGYFAWVADNPLFEPKAFNVQGGVKIVEVPKLRAMTIGGLCIHLGISTMTWSTYRSKKNYEDICLQADTIIRTQKFEGAAADIFNPSIITRDLGLRDAKEVSGDDGGPLEIRLVKYAADD